MPYCIRSVISTLKSTARLTSKPQCRQLRKISVASYAADLHIHSSFTYAVSYDLTLPNLAKWACMKLANLLATREPTHCCSSRFSKP